MTRHAPLRALLACSTLLAAPALADVLQVMRTGLGDGTITSDVGGIDCGPAGTVCTVIFTSPGTPVRFTATAAPGSTFVGWNVDLDPTAPPSPDCSGSATTCTLSTFGPRSVKAKFDLLPPAAVRPLETVPGLVPDAITPEKLQEYLAANPQVNTVAKFVAALPEQYRRNWLMMTRSESLQTGTAEHPRILLSSHSAKTVFSIGLGLHDSYPASHPLAIELMQWDAEQRNFRFHELRLQDLSTERRRGLEFDDLRCTKCHSTRNVRNDGATPGTDGIPPGTIIVKSKPNWDPYDSWAGLLAFNRDRIHKGSVEAAAFRRLLNAWTWRSRPDLRATIEQLQLQPPGVATRDQIRRVRGGRYDDTPLFSFDPPSWLGVEAPPGGMHTAYVSYEFNRQAGTSPTPVLQASETSDGDFMQLFSPGPSGSASSSDEGRGVELFDQLSDLNLARAGHEVAYHTHATSHAPIDVRPIALAVGLGCLTTSSTGHLSNTTPYPFTVGTTFFDARHGRSLAELYEDTFSRARTLPRRKADLQRLNLDRSEDPYVRVGSDGMPMPVDGLIREYGATTTAGVSTAMPRLRQEVFQRPGADIGRPDMTEMGGVYVDRETYFPNVERVTLYRYFLEPLGIPVDKWSLGVRGRSRGYAFADVLGRGEALFLAELNDSLRPGRRPRAGLTAPVTSCTPELMSAVNASLSAAALPDADQVPRFTDVQRIFNKACIECHGGLDYPPYVNRGRGIDLSENPAAPPGERVLGRSYDIAVALARSTDDRLFDRITRQDEDCYDGMMPCGGPPLSPADIETLRRWIEGGHSDLEGDPHLRTLDGTRYDFQAAGEFVLFREEGVEVQGRFTPVQTQQPVGPDAHTGLSECASITTALAIRIGKHRLTYQPTSVQQPKLELRVDGKLISSFGPELRLAGGGRLMATPTADLQVETPGGTIISVTSRFWTHYQVAYLNVNVRGGRGTEGLLGNLPRGSWLPALPDGSSVGPRPGALGDRHDVLYGAFANAWRVSHATSLFDYAAGTSTSDYQLPWWPEKAATSCKVVGAPPTIPVRPALKPLSPKVAAQYCSKLVDPARRRHCEQDVAATGDPVFAAGYLAVQQHESNRAPLPAKLLMPADGATAATTVVFKWQPTSDPDGHPVTYRHCIWSVDDRFTMKACDLPGTGLNRTRTLAAGQDYLWKVIVEDGQGGTIDGKTHLVRVR